jgi:hypothetical protein
MNKTEELAFVKTALIIGAYAKNIAQMTGFNALELVTMVQVGLQSEANRAAKTSNTSTT